MLSSASLLRDAEGVTDYFHQPVTVLNSGGLHGIRNVAQKDKAAATYFDELEREGHTPVRDPGGHETLTYWSHREILSAAEEQEVPLLVPQDHNEITVSVGSRPCGWVLRTLQFLRWGVVPTEPQPADRARQRSRFL